MKVDNDIAFVQVALSRLRSRKRLVALWTGICAVVALAIAILWPPKWTATASFLPVAQSGQNLPSGLSAVASQLGFSLQSSGEVSPRFYGDLIRGRVVLFRLLADPIPDSLVAVRTTGPVSLGQWLVGSTGAVTERAMYQAYRRLERSVSSRADNTTRLVSFSVTLSEPRVAVWTAEQLIAEANRFNREVYRSTAKARREFLEGRLREAQDELHVAEDALAAFYTQNRQWQNAPQLAVREGRLRRDITLHQDLFNTLSQQYEVARIDEVNETPLITVVDDPWVPPQRSSPRRALIVVAGTMIGLAAGWIAAMAPTSKARQGAL